jgi:hypothetical protein
MGTFDELLNSQNRLSRKEMAGIGGGYRYKYHIECTDGSIIDGVEEIPEGTSDERELEIFDGLIAERCKSGHGHGWGC